MVSYLRTCLARSAGVKDPHCTAIADWKPQAPAIAKYILSLAGKDEHNQPAKQQKLSAESTAPSERFTAADSINTALESYCQLLMQNAQVQAGE